MFHVLRNIHVTGNELTEYIHQLLFIYYYRSFGGGEEKAYANRITLLHGTWNNALYLYCN